MSGVQPEAFFLEAPSGRLFALWFGPTAPARALVLAPPFGEELNKCRRMIAEQARAFARRDTAVLLMDLFGTGDSEGELAAASWSNWCSDLEFSIQWLRERVKQPVGIWGVRMGALLASAAATSGVPKVDELVLWQPVLKGEAQLTEFLRLKVASEMMTQGTPKLTTRSLREALASGEVLEVAGYDLTPSLAASLDAASLSNAPPSVERVVWLQVQRTSGLPMPQPAAKLIESWRNSGVDVVDRCVVGETFWNTQEISECPALIQATIEASGATEQVAAGSD